MYPDIEVLLIAYLADQTGLRVLTDLPDDVDQQLPVHRLTCSDGADDGLRLDSSLIDFDTFAATRGEASALANSVRGLLLNLRGQTQPTGVVTGVRTVVKPHWLPDPNPNLRRYNAAYQVFAHA